MKPILFPFNLLFQEFPNSFWEKRVNFKSYICQPIDAEDNTEKIVNDVLFRLCVLKGNNASEFLQW